MSRSAVDTCRRLSALLGLLVTFAMPAQAQVTFEGMVGPLTTHLGFTWSNWYSYDWSDPYYALSGLQNGTVSGDFGAVNTTGLDAAIARANPFTFGGAWFTSVYRGDYNNPEEADWYSPYWSDELAIFGYRQGSAVYQATFTITWQSPTFFLANWTNIDRLVFQGRPYPNTVGSEIIMDDIYFQPLSISVPVEVVPEPASMILTGTGLAAIMMARRRRTAA